MPAYSAIDAWPDWEARFGAFLRTRMSEVDAAHDRAHVDRVVATARRLAADEGARLEVVIPAAWLHDCVVVSKDEPRRDRASQQAADAAGTFLLEAGYPEGWIEPIEHAIAAHSYSGDVSPETVEAEVVQDADRLDALGAVGIARCFMVGGALDRPFYDVNDPFCNDRPPDDETYTLDHFYAKLLRLPSTMNTETGREEAERRVQFVRTYLDHLAREIDGE